jgi:hypothetical protein
MIDPETFNEILKQPEPTIKDFNVIATYDRQTEEEFYYFIRKGRTIDIWSPSPTQVDRPFGGNIGALKLAMACDHIVKKKDMEFTVIKCRTRQDGAVPLRLMAEYIESCY